MLENHTLPDGRRLQYALRDHGAGEHPPVVFCNGLSQTTVAWGLQVKRLAGVRNALVWDASGQGRSDPPRAVHRPEGHAADLLDLLDGLGLPQVDVIGFSFGSRIALRLALAAPERVRRLVLVGCAHRETTLRRWIVKGWLDAMEHGGHAHLFQVVTPMVMGEDWLRLNEHTRAAMLKAFVRRNDAEGIRRLLADSVLPGGDLSDELRGVAHPTLVLRGEHDLVVPDWLNRELCELLPDARYAECPALGHSVAIESPGWFADRVREHIVEA